MALVLLQWALAAEVTFHLPGARSGRRHSRKRGDDILANLAMAEPSQAAVRWTIHGPEWQFDARSHNGLQSAPALISTSHSTPPRPDKMRIGDCPTAPAQSGEVRHDQKDCMKSVWRQTRNVNNAARRTPLELSVNHVLTECPAYAYIRIQYLGWSSAGHGCGRSGAYSVT